MTEQTRKNLKLRTSIDITIISARLGCAKDELSRDPNFLLRVNFIRKNPMKKIEERIKSKKAKLKDSLMYFNEEKISFNDIDYDNDIIEVSLSLINEKEKQFRYSIIRIKDLVMEKEVDEIWTLNSQSLVNIKYKVYHEYVEDILTDLAFVYKYLDSTNNANTSTKNECGYNIGILKNKLNESPVVNKYHSIIAGSGSYTKNPNSLNLSGRKNVSFYPGIKSNYSRSIAWSKERESIPIPIKSVKSFNKSVGSRIISANGIDDSVKLSKLYTSNIVFNNSKSNNISVSALSSTFSGEIIDCELLDQNSTEVESYETFCEAFFVSGLRTRDVHMISEFEQLKSSCGHVECSLLPAYRPGILYKFIKKNQSLDINNMTAGLCFPNGMKICYIGDEQNSKPETRMNVVNTFMNIITNQKGETFYLFNFFYYKRIDNETFKDNFDFDPVREYLKNFSDRKSSGVKKEKELQICSNLILSKYKYVPECISLITKYPYAKQVEKCLETIYKLLKCSDRKDRNQKSGSRLNFNAEEELVSLLSHLVNEVPLPPINKKLMFYIPFNCIEISSAYMKELPILNYHLRSLLDDFSIENLILIFNLIILEQKLLFIHVDFSRLSEISQSLLAVIQPMTWVNTYIPVLSEEIIKYLQSFIPFVMGIDENLLNLAYKNGYLEPDEDNKIFLVNITKKTIGVSTSKKDKKICRKNLMKEGVPELPQEVNDLLTSELKALKKVLDESKNKNNLNLPKVDMTIREIFMKGLVMLFGDYKKYVSFTEEGVVTFNSECFFINRAQTHTKFFQELIQTQIFKEFLQREKINHRNNKNTFSNYSFFNNMCTRHMSLINPPAKVKSTKKSSSVSQCNLVIVQTHLISGDISLNRNSSTVKNNILTPNKVTPNISTIKRTSIADTSHSLNTSDFINSKSEIYSLSLANEITASNSKDMSDCFLITPYFVNDPICKFDPVKIEEIMAKKFSQDESLDLEMSRRILENQFSLCEGKHIKIMRRYFIKENQLNNELSQMQNYNSAGPLRKQGIYVANSDERVSNSPGRAKTSETVMNTINECLSVILSVNNTQTLSLKGHESVKKILGLKQGRLYFANKLNKNLSQESKTENSFSLSQNSFNDLSKLIYTFLIFCEDNQNEYKEIRQVTRASFNYYRSDTKRKKTNYIYEELAKKQISIWQSDRLWVRWFELEIEEEKDNNVFPNIEDFYFTILLKLGSYMSALGLNYKKINQCIVKEIAPGCLNQNKESSQILIKELEESLEKQSHRV